ncbi:MAG: DUF4358 domain-containing protein [Ruminococcaceae bacterium]|nr:DUF4358 domain-containing protein [Oscillospiraceae bacterium]
MKHIRLISLGTAVVLSLALLTACGGDKAPVSGSESMVEPDVSISQPEASTPDIYEDVPPVELPQVIRSLALNKTDFTLKTAGASYKLVAEVTGVEDPVILWSSSDEAVATVDEKGVVTAVAAGTATITAALEGTDMTVDCTVRCNIKTEEQPAPEVKPEDPAPEVKPEEKPAQPAPEAPAKVDLNAFYNGIFTDPDNAPTMVAMDNDALDAFYAGLNAISLKQKVAYMPMMTAVPCEIVMVECANAADVAAVKAIFNARISAQVDNHFNYPMVIEAWETEAKVVSNGNFVALFVVSGMTDQVVANFNALF